MKDNEWSGQKHICSSHQAAWLGVEIRMKHKTTKLILMIALFTMLSGIANADIRLNVPIYRQTDPLWNTDPLGTCSWTIGQQGCAISSVAMVFKYYGKQTNPKDFNNWLKTEKYYSDGCLIQWENAAKITGNVVTWIDTYSTNWVQIKNELNHGYPVIARVNRGESPHFVVITGYIGSSFYINDPFDGAKDKILSSSEYPTVFGIYLYHGPAKLPISGDMNGDGIDETGTFNRSTNIFNFGSKSVTYAMPGDSPIIGDWDYDGKDEIGVFRPIEGSISKLYLITRDWNSLGTDAGSADYAISFSGLYSNNIPISGNWDGLGGDDIGLFNPSTNTFYLYTLNPANLGATLTTRYKDVPPFGETGDIPIAGDWDKNGKGEIGVFRPNENNFYLDKDLTGNQAEFGSPYQYGISGDLPIIGDWAPSDGDDNIGVYTPLTGGFLTYANIPPDQPRYSADLNSDEIVNSVDFGILMSCWNDTNRPRADINQDGIVNSVDFGIMMSMWTV